MREGTGEGKREGKVGDLPDLQITKTCTQDALLQQEYSDLEPLPLGT